MHVYIYLYIVYTNKYTHIYRHHTYIKHFCLSHIHVLNLQIIADFDMTMTSFMVNGGRGKSSHRVVEDSEFFDEDYRKVWRESFVKSDHWEPSPLSEKKRMTSLHSDHSLSSTATEIQRSFQSLLSHRDFNQYSNGREDQAYGWMVDQGKGHSANFTSSAHTFPSSYHLFVVTCTRDHSVASCF